MIPGPRLSLSLLCMALSSLPPLTRLTWEFLFTSPGPPEPGLTPDSSSPHYIVSTAGIVTVINKRAVTVWAII